IVSAKRKHPTDPRPESVDRAPPVLIQERTGLLFSRHPKAWKDDTVRQPQLNMFCQKSGKILPRTPGQKPDIPGVQQDGAAHAMAAGRASLAAPTVCLHHILCRVELSIGNVLQPYISPHPLILPFSIFQFK